MSSENTDCVSSQRGQSDSPYAVSPGSNRWPGRPLVCDGWICLFTVFNNVSVALLAHLFEGELKLCRVEKESKQELWVVLGVVEYLVLDLTQPLVVWVVSLLKNKNEGERQHFSHIQSYQEQKFLHVMSKVKGLKD